MAPLPTSAPRPFPGDPGILTLTRAPLLSREQEDRLAAEIDLARNRLFAELVRAAAAAASDDPRTLDIPATIDHIASDGLRAGARELASRFDQAVGRLAMHNTRLVVSIARRYVDRGIPLADLVQEGILGLLKAARRFELRRGFRFSTSATWWIRQAVVRALQDRSRLIRIPARALDVVSRFRRVRAALAQRLDREPSIEEIAGESHLSPRKALEISALLTAPISMDGAARVGEERTMAETLGFEVEPDADRLREDLARALEHLTGREREVLTRRHGLGGFEPATLEEIGRALGLTREGIRQIEIKATEKLRRILPRLGWTAD